MKTNRELEDGRLERQRRKARFALFVTVIIALCCAGSILFMEICDLWRAQMLQDELKELYRPQASVAGWLSIFMNVASAEEEITQEPTNAAQTMDETLFVEPPVIHEDFLQLYKKNNDIVGWLAIGERIDYPVVQYDNTYYLDHNYLGERDNNGTLFVNEHNSLWPRDDVILIHGHNMKSGAMFGTLKKFEDYEYLKEHPLVIFRTIWDEADVYYVPVAAFNASMVPGAEGYFDITQIVFADDMEETPTPGAITGMDLEVTPAPTTSPTPNPTPTPSPTPAPVFSPALGETEPSPTPVRKSAEYQAYLDALMEWSEWESPVEVNVDDQLLMLVTCSYQHEDGRLMLVCRKLRQNETPESITALFAVQGQMVEGQ